MREQAASWVKVCRVTMTIGVEGYELTKCCRRSLLLEAKLASWCMCCSMGINFSFRSTGVSKPGKHNISKNLHDHANHWFM